MYALLFLVMMVTSEIRSLQELKQRLIEIKNMGWVATTRHHDTGIGKTFEDLLGIQENNLQIPDIGEIEVKSSRDYTSSFMTLITFEPSEEFRNVEWTLDGLVNAFGKTGDDKVTGLPVFHITVSSTKYTGNTQQFKLDIRNIQGEEMVCIVTKKKFKPLNSNLPSDVVACFPVKEIMERISRKLGGCLLVIEAETKKEGNTEKFKLKSAKLYAGFSAPKFIQLIRQGKICLDIRFGRYKSGAKKGQPHNHGTAWRIRKKDVLELYSQEIDILHKEIPEDIKCERVIYNDTKDTKKEKEVPLTEFLKKNKLTIILLLL